MAARLPRLVRPRAPRVSYRGPCLLCQAEGSFPSYCSACARAYQAVRRAELAGKAPQGATLTWLRETRAKLAATRSAAPASESARQTG